MALLNRQQLFMDGTLVQLSRLKKEVIYAQIILCHTHTGFHHIGISSRLWHWKCVSLYTGHSEESRQLGCDLYHISQTWVTLFPCWDNEAWFEQLSDRPNNCDMPFGWVLGRRSDGQWSTDRGWFPTAIVDIREGFGYIRYNLSIITVALSELRCTMVSEPRRTRGKTANRIEGTIPNLYVQSNIWIIVVYEIHSLNKLRYTDEEDDELITSGEDELTGNVLTAQLPHFIAVKVPKGPNCFYSLQLILSGFCLIQSTTVCQHARKLIRASVTEQRGKEVLQCLIVLAHTSAPGLWPLLSVRHIAYRGNESPERSELVLSIACLRLASRDLTSNLIAI
jgi:hypothetical protein